MPGGQGREVFIFGLFPVGSHAAGMFDADVAQGGRNGFHAAAEHVAAQVLAADAQGGGVLHHDFRQAVCVLGQADHAEQYAGPGFLHADGLGVDVPRPGLKQPLHGKGDVFAGHVVQIALELGDRFPLSFAFAQEGADAVGPLKILFPHAVADGLGLHDGPVPKARGEMLEQGRPSGRAQLALHLAAVGGHVAEDQRRRRGGHRQNAVHAAHVPAAHVNGGDDDLVRGELFHQQADGDDVRHGVHRADLVKVNLADGTAVGGALRLCD